MGAEEDGPSPAARGERAGGPAQPCVPGREPPRTPQPDPPVRGDGAGHRAGLRQGLQRRRFRRGQRHLRDRQGWRGGDRRHARRREHGGGAAGLPGDLRVPGHGPGLYPQPRRPLGRLPGPGDTGAGGQRRGPGHRPAAADGRDRPDQRLQPADHGGPGRLPVRAIPRLLPAGQGQRGRRTLPRPDPDRGSGAAEHAAGRPARDRDLRHHDGDRLGAQRGPRRDRRMAARPGRAADRGVRARRVLPQPVHVARRRAPPGRPVGALTRRAPHVPGRRPGQVPRPVGGRDRGLPGSPAQLPGRHRLDPRPDGPVHEPGLRPGPDRREARHAAAPAGL